MAVRPSAEMRAGAEGSAAQEALAAEPEAVGAYDRVPVRSAAAVFTMDTASEVFMLHSAKVRAAGMSTLQAIPRTHQRVLFGVRSAV